MGRTIRTFSLAGLGLTLAALGTAVLPAPPAAALESELYVAQGGTDAGTCSSGAIPCATVTYALAQAAVGATVHVSGTIVDNVEITKAVTITGEGAASPAVLDGSNLAPVVDTNASGLVTLDDLTITHGSTTAFGGGIISTGGSVVLSDSTVTANASRLQGGGIWHRATGNLTVRNSTISANSAGNCGTCLTHGGGGINVDGTDGGDLVVVDSTISGNTTSSGGGGLEANDFATITVLRSTISGNQGTSGGGVHGYDTTITESTITGNSATYGGGAWNVAGVVLQLNESTVTGNKASHSGGGITNQLGTVQLRGSIVAKNTVDGVTPDNCATHGVGTFTWTSYGYNLADMDHAECGLTKPSDVTGDPLLGALADNGGRTRTMMPGAGSPARNRVPAGTVLGGTTMCRGDDQRGYLRPQTGAVNCAIGAVEPGNVQAIAPTFTSAAQTTVASGTPFNFLITTSAKPAPTITMPTGTLPPGTSFVDNGNGTATLSGITTLQGSYAVTFEADNDVYPRARQAFVIDVGPGSATYLAVDDIRVSEGSTGAPQATFTVTRSGNLDKTTMIDVATVAGTAGASDFTPVPSTTLTFGPTTEARTVSVALNPDKTYEPDETFKLVLTPLLNASLSDAEATATIVNDDAFSSVSVGDVMVAEGNTGATPAAVFRLTRSGSLTQPATVAVATQSGTATAGIDFTAVPTTTVSFPAGVATVTSSVVLTGDDAGESNETFRLNLSAPVGTVIADNTGWATIVDDEPRTFLSVSNAVVTEGNTGTTTATFTLKRSGSLTGESSVKVATSNGSAVAGSDYTALGATTVRWAAGQAVKTVAVPVRGDTLAESNETFRLNLSAATGGTVDDAIGLATIVDNEGPVTSGPRTFVTISDTSVVEGASGTRTAVFTLTRTGNLTGTSTVNVVTSDGTATAGSDYVPRASFTVSFSATVAVRQVSVTVNGDAMRDGDEFFNLDLSGVSGAMLLDGRGTARIVNDDITYIGVTDAVRVEGPVGITSAITYTVTRGGALAGTSTVSVASADGTATVAGNDYTARPATTVTFGPNEKERIVTVVVRGDTNLEPDETMRLVLSGVTGAGYSDTTGVGTIANDDLPSYVAVDDLSITEGDSGVPVATFTVKRTGLLTTTSSVTVATANGTAAAGADYVALPATVLSFASGQDRRTVSVKLTPDNLDELDETFQLRLTSPANAVVVDAAGTASIVDDD